MQTSRPCAGCGAELAKRPGPGRFPKWCDACVPASTRTTRARRERNVAADAQGFRDREAQRQRTFQDEYRAEHGEPYTSRYLDQRRSSAIAATAEGRGYRQRNPDGARASDERRVERIRERTVDEFDRIAVFERDKYVCGICSEPVDRALSHPHPLCASVDHIVPLFAGGEHSLANVRCAHLVCNMRRQRLADLRPA